MKAWIVYAEYGYYEDDDYIEEFDSYIVGIYTNLALAGRAAIQSFFHLDSHRPVEYIKNFFTKMDDSITIFGVKNCNYLKVTINPTLINRI